uniref:Uncharacterized protein n=1 Tax=Hyaloperonospora arabidopsidis (strain Emoy2) TaxID=559515 RepID=M4B322_HYAAE
MVETELPRLAEGISFSSDSDVPVLSSGSRRKRKRKRKKEAYRSPRRRPNTDEDDSVVPEILCALEYMEDSLHRDCYIKGARPPCTVEEITSLSALPCIFFLHDPKAGDIEQVCILSAADVASKEVLEARPKSDETKSSREERFAAQSWEVLRASGNPVHDIAREYADIFPKRIPAELPADRGVRHGIDLVPGSQYCNMR